MVDMEVGNEKSRLSHRGAPYDFSPLGEPMGATTGDFDVVVVPFVVASSDVWRVVLICPTFRLWLRVVRLSKMWVLRVLRMGMLMRIVGHLDQDITGDVGFALVIEIDLCVGGVGTVEMLLIHLNCGTVDNEVLQLGSSLRIDADVNGVVGSSLNISVANASVAVDVLYTDSGGTVDSEVESVTVNPVGLLASVGSQVEADMVSGLVSPNRFETLSIGVADHIVSPKKEKVATAGVGDLLNQLKPKGKGD
ncbi:hypothetical protein V6N12_021065 [Hibiscus sabdariffa]|uniref:Uncharacterized protein n=1 Tax=Hibiscus sabdariffa TaxID=183260 RepID=A0ABR2B515_9ROSI